tara:strand:+ start:223 stop:756 length:534 start_codon:yes stop_codon:yes gene_type:complete
MKHNKLKAIFLDRDGVINKEIGFLHKADDFVFVDGIFESCRYFQAIGFVLIVITNQSGITRGYYKESDFHILTDWMIKKFLENNIQILDVFFCPHGVDSTCNCRKPNPGMLLSACSKYNINMKKSWMIGDKETDIKAANLAGIQNTILMKSGHEIDADKSDAKFILKSIHDSIKLIK